MEYFQMFLKLKVIVELNTAFITSWFELGIRLVLDLVLTLGS